MNSSRPTTKKEIQVEPHKQFTPQTPDPFRPVESIKTDFESSPTTVRTKKNLSVRNTFAVSDNETNNQRGQRFKRMVSASNYSVQSSDYLVGITNLAVARTVELPRPPLAGVGKIFIVKDELGGAATTNITIRSSGDANIDGATTLAISTNYGSRSLYCDGTQWFTY